MPYINTKTNVELTKGIEESIAQKFGKAIELIPGKSEEWLMLSFEDRSSLYFKGQSDEPMAYVEVKVFGSSAEDAYQKLTAAITEILKEELSINPDHVYVRYEETKYWGWNGNNF